MSTPPSAPPFIESLLGKLGEALTPPGWVVEEAQRRMVLALNHVLQQEPEAQARLKRQAGRLVEGRWRSFVVRLRATPAGLLELGPQDAAPDLTVTLAEDSPWTLAQSALRGDKPPVRIAGDVQLAAEVQWLADHVRWDVEEDLARLFGDAPAHAIGQALRRVGQALRQFAGAAGRPPGGGSGSSSPGEPGGPGA